MVRLVKTVAFSAIIGSCLLGGCKGAEKGEEQCQLPKPGKIVSVNEYCPVQIADTVDPAIVYEWKGQKVSLCCDNCRPTWEKMTPAEKDKALAAAIAKGKIKK